MLSHVAGPNNFLGQTEAKARYSLVQSLARIWLQQNRIHRSYLEELLAAGAVASCWYGVPALAGEGQDWQANGQGGGAPDRLKPGHRTSARISEPKNGTWD